MSKAACLDNIIINAKISQELTEVTEFPMSDQRSQSLNYFHSASAEQSDRSTTKSKIVLSRPISDEKIDRLKDSLFNVDWYNVLNRPCKSCMKLTTQVVFKRIFERFIFIFDNCMPVRKCKLTKPSISNKELKKNKAWYSPHLAKMKSTVLLLLDNYNKVRTDKAKLAYVKIRNEYKFSLIQAKKTFNSNLIEKSSNKMQISLEDNKSTKDGNSEILVSADEFNDFFVSSVNQLTSTIARPHQELHSYFIKNYCQLPQKHLVLLRSLL